MEAAKEWGYKLGEWQCETIVNRAKAMAHVLYMGIRRSYEDENRGEKKKGDKLESLMHQMGI